MNHANVSQVALSQLSQQHEAADPRNLFPCDSLHLAYPLVIQVNRRGIKHVLPNVQDLELFACLITPEHFALV